MIFTWVGFPCGSKHTCSANIWLDQRAGNTRQWASNCQDKYHTQASQALMIDTGWRSPFPWRQGSCHCDSLYNLAIPTSQSPSSSSLRILKKHFLNLFILSAVECTYMSHGYNLMEVWQGILWKHVAYGVWGSSTPVVRKSSSVIYSNL